MERKGCVEECAGDIGNHWLEELVGKHAGCGCEQPKADVGSVDPEEFEEGVGNLLVAEDKGGDGDHESHDRSRQCKSNGYSDKVVRTGRIVRSVQGGSESERDQAFEKVDDTEGDEKVVDLDRRDALMNGASAETVEFGI